MTSALLIVLARENQSSDKRDLIVKLCRRDLISACRRQQNPSIFINESLTPSRKTILNQGGYVLEKFLKCSWKKKFVLDFFKLSDVLEMFLKKIIHVEFY